MWMTPQTRQRSGSATTSATQSSSSNRWNKSSFVRICPTSRSLAAALDGILQSKRKGVQFQPIMERSQIMKKALTIAGVFAASLTADNITLPNGADCSPTKQALADVTRARISAFGTDDPGYLPDDSKYD